MSGRAGLRLRPFRLDDEPAAVAAHEEMQAEGFTFLLGWEPGTAWEEYVATLEANRCGERLPEGFVPGTFLAAEHRGELVGRTSIRHRLTPYLAREGGHVGYGVVAAHRRRGHATEILRQSLVVARAVGVERVLVTCADDNVGSAAVIERCGGLLESRVDPPGGGTPLRRYWIE